jgi:hypothetical protein
MEKNIGLPKSIGYTHRQHCLNFLYAFEAGEINDMLNLCEEQAFVHFVPLGKSFSGHVHSLGRIFWNAFLESFPISGLSYTIPAGSKKTLTR